MTAISNSPETDALRDSFGGDCCGEAHEALLLSAKFEAALAGVRAGTHLIVPKEPTREQLRAMDVADCGPLSGRLLRVYKAALAASGET